jgi:hypothetical protein
LNWPVVFTTSITSRGDGREDIYRTDADRNTWLTVLGQVCERFNWAKQMGSDTINNLSIARRLN